MRLTLKRSLSIPISLGNTFMCNKILKHIALLTLLLWNVAPAIATAQQPSQLTIKTITYTFRSPGISEEESFVPQLTGHINKQVQEKINADIRHLFIASRILEDTSAYINSLMKEWSATSRADLQKKMEDMQADAGGSDQSTESYSIPYLSETLFSLNYTLVVEPVGGRPQFFAESIHYDLQTGKRLKLSDFIDVKKVNYDVVQRNGYSIDYYDNNADSIQYVPVDSNDTALKNAIASEDTTDESCDEFYFKQIDGDLHIQFTMQCLGPFPSVYGIQLKYLKESIIDGEFKNELNLWGKNIDDLRGQSLQHAGNKIHFADYDVMNGGGYIVHSNNKTDTTFAISFWISDKSLYYLLEKMPDHTVTDILEFKKDELKGNTIIDSHCVTDKPDAEIIAVVRNDAGNKEYYTHIVKAWRAASVTGKFVNVVAKKVKKCYSE